MCGVTRTQQNLSLVLRLASPSTSEGIPVFLLRQRGEAVDVDDASLRMSDGNALDPFGAQDGFMGVSRLAHGACPAERTFRRS